MPPPTYILIHSPLVSAMTWELVAGELRARGREAVVAALDCAVEGERPFWRRHARSIAALGPAEGSVVLVAHSGAGPLMPAVVDLLPGRDVRCVLADASLAEDGRSRLQTFGDADALAAFRAAAVDGMLPAWTAEQMESQIADPGLRARHAASLRPTPLAIYEEPLPVPASWVAVPCAYLQFSPAYDRQAERARALGWAVRHTPGTHFHMLNDPGTVVAAVVGMAKGAVELT